ncbi:MAG TPA: DUF2939 domain-containing protein [Lysobacter sp.]
MKKGTLIGAAIGLVLVYLAATPYIAVYQMKSAIESRDGQALAEFIDFPSVRQSAKDQFNAMAVKEIASADGEASGLAAVGAALVGAMVEKFIDAAVTPAGLTKLIESGERKGVLGSRLTDASTSYAGWDKFIVTTGSANEQGKFVLRRQGLISWKLTEVILPDSIFDQTKEPEVDDATAAAIEAADGVAPLSEPTAPVSVTAANFTPLLTTNYVVSQGRCNMGSCDWTKWVSAKSLSSEPGETLISFNVLNGSSEHPGDVAEYPSTSDGVNILWGNQAQIVVVRCSHSRPSVKWEGQEEVNLPLSPSGISGYQEGDAAMYFMACHSDQEPYPVAIERYGYNVQFSG